MRPGGRVLVITGAGISAESGLPTYRGVGGLYDGIDTDLGLPIEVALSGPMFRRRPEVTWRYIAQIESAVRGAKHNRAHDIVAGLEKRFEVVVLTQNVDGFHRAAGSSRVIDIHGDCHDLSCTRCPWKQTVPDYAALEMPPRCPSCGGVVRPDVVLFGEMLQVEKVERLEAEMSRGFDVCFSIGTTSVFPYIAGPVIETAARGGLAVEINPGESEVSAAASVRLRVGAIAALSAIADALGPA